METINKLLSKLKSGNMFSAFNKYTAAIFIFCVWIGFIDRYSVINQCKLSKNVYRLEQAKADYELQLEEAIKERDIINSDIEKYARERYLFHKENEQVILIK